MAGQVNTKFIANPSFMIQSVGKQTISVGWRPLYSVTTPYVPGIVSDEITSNIETRGGEVRSGEGTPATGKYIGFADMPLGLLAQLLGGLSSSEIKGGVVSGIGFSPISVSLQPEMTLKCSNSTADTATATGIKEIQMNGIVNFLNFLEKNPIHVTKLNVRASSAAMLPSVLEILTPNVFSGQYDRQVVNIIADTNMYQNQGNIVTLDCDFFISRTSILRVDSAFEVEKSAGTPALAMDFTFDKYLSLEKALVENYELMQTEAGMAAAVTEEVSAINAKLPVAEVVPLQPVQLTSTLQGIKTWKPAIGGSAAPSVQPNVAKGGNFM